MRSFNNSSCATKKIACISIAIIAFMMVTPSAAFAECSNGFFGGGLCRLGIPNDLDQKHKEFGQPLDAAGRAVAQIYNVPVSPYCVTPFGIFVGPWGPINSPCNVNGVWGVLR